MKTDLFIDVFCVSSRGPGNRSYHQANIYFTNWVKQDGETEVFCALMGVNDQIMRVNRCG